MKKKTFVIIIAILVLIALGIFLAGYLVSKKEAPESGRVDGGFGGFWGDLNPFGGNSTGTQDGEAPSEESETSDGIIKGEPFNPLVKLSDTAVAGAVFSGKNAEYAQYVERSTGHVFEVTLDGLAKARISQITAPKMHEALWTDGGKTILLRYLREDGETITSFARKSPERIAPIPSVGESATTTAEGTLLPDGILHAIVSNDGKTVFYVKKDAASKKLFGYSGELRNSGAKKVFEHDFTEWLPVRFDGKVVWLQTKSSKDAPGYLYTLNISTGSLQKILGDIKGLTTLPSPDGKKILYSESTRGSFKTFLYDVASSESVLFPVATLPEKCAWQSTGGGVYCAVPERIPTGDYPDAWYMGLVSFTDKLWWIELDSMHAYPVLAPTVGGQDIEMVSIQLSTDSTRVLFINKKNSTLWLYRPRG